MPTRCTLAVYRQPSVATTYNLLSGIIDDYSVNPGEPVARDRLDVGNYFAQVTVDDRPDLKWGQHFTIEAGDSKEQHLRFALPEISSERLSAPIVPSPLSESSQIDRPSRIRGRIQFDDGTPIRAGQVYVDGMRPGRIDGHFEGGTRGDPPHLTFDLHSVRGWPGVPYLRRALADFVSSSAFELRPHVTCLVHVPVTTASDTQDVVIDRSIVRTLTVETWPRSNTESDIASYRSPSAHSWELTVDAGDYWVRYTAAGIANDSAGEMAYWLDEDTFVIRDVVGGRAVLSYRDREWGGVVALKNVSGDESINLRELPAGSIAGTIHFADGTPYTGSVYLSSPGTPQYFGVLRALNALPENRPQVSATVDAVAGEFRFPHLTPGTYTISAGEFFRGATKEITLSAGDAQEVDMTLMPLSAPEGLPLREE